MSSQPPDEGSAPREEPAESESVREIPRRPARKTTSETVSAPEADTPPGGRPDAVTPAVEGARWQPIRQAGNRRALAGIALVLVALFLYAGAPSRSGYPERPSWRSPAWWFSAPEDNGFRRLPSTGQPDFLHLARAPDSSRLWAGSLAPVGQAGLWLSEDGGRTWARQPLPTGPGVAALAMLAGGQGRVLTGDGWLLSTRDDGRRWRLARTPLATPRSGGGDYGQRGSGPGWSLFASAWAEAPPPVQKTAPEESGPPANAPANQAAQQRFDTSPNLSKGDSGSAAQQALTPAQSAAAPLPERAQALAFADGLRGVLASTRRLWFTGDGGQAWTEVLRVNDEELLAVQADAQGWSVLGTRGLYRAGPDAGRWDRVYTAPGMLSGWGQAGTSRLLLGAGGAMSALNGRYEIPLESGTAQPLYAAATIGRGTVLAVGGAGTVLRSVDEGASWKASPVPDPVAGLAARDVLALGDGRAVLVGDGGTVLLSDDAGQSWQPLQAARYPPPAAWLLGLGGLGLMLGRLRVSALAWFAPWRSRWRRYWSPETEPPSGAWAPADVQPIVISDVALERAEQDRLGMAALARGLAFFLRNENTRPPVTLAITGAWGSGKSSLMRMLKTELERAWYFPVWLNAWHHHEEEHLYGALLETLRQQGLPPFWRVSGFGLRLKLAWIRTKRHWPTLTLLAGLVVMGWWLQPKDEPCAAPPRDQPFVLDAAFQSCLSGHAGLSSPALDALQPLAARAYATPLAFALELNAPGAPVLAQDDKMRLLRALGVAREALKAPEAHAALEPNSLKQRLAELLTLLENGEWLERARQWLASGAGLTGVLGLVTAFLRGTSAFGLRPERLLRSATEETGADPGLRFRVHQALRDICQAMGRRGPVIFIDDLDRCPPEQMKRVFECINFLADNERRCVIVLGAALDRVLPALASQFDTQVREAAYRYPDQNSDWTVWRALRPQGVAEPTGKSQDNDEVWEEWLRLKRREYAESYLEKLINLEVSVPTAPIAAMPELVLARPEPPAPRGLRHWFDRLLLPALLSLMAAVVAALVVLPLLTAAEEESGPVVTMAPDNPAPNLAPSVSAPASAIETQNVPLATQAAGGELASAAVTGREALNASVNLWYGLAMSLIVGVALLLVFGGLGSRILFATAEIAEGALFTRALQIWKIALTCQNVTPRHFKLLVNQLRLMAMRALAEMESEAEQARQEGREALSPEAHGRALAVRFVMLSALEEAGVDLPRFLASEGGRASYWLNPDAAPLPAGCYRLRETPAPALEQALAVALAEHAQLAVQAWPGQADLERYRRLKGDVILR